MNITFGEVEMDVEFDYQPGEPEERYHSDGGGYPGCGAEIIITSIEVDGVGVMDQFKDQMDEIAWQLFDERNKYSDYDGDY